MLKKLLIFFVLNFSALALGGLFTGDGVISDWYAKLAKAPWTPPGWVFGAAWFSIMLCYTVYMAYAWDLVNHKRKLLLLFATQWILNVSWNPAFFLYHRIGFSLLIILGLTILVGYQLIANWQSLKSKSLLLLPYFIWLWIASSLNAYIFWYN